MFGLYTRLGFSILCSLFLLSVAASAAGRGGDVGNGGGAMVCDENGTRQWSSLDLWEAEHRFGLTIVRSDKPVKAQLRAISEKIKRSDFAYYELYTKAMKEVFKRRRDLKKGTHINPISDANVVVNHEGCRVVQLAGYFNADVKEILNIDPEYMRLLRSRTDQAALWVHEAVYKLERDYYGTKEVTSSDHARMVVGHLFSTADFIPRSIFYRQNSKKLPPLEVDEQGNVYVPLAESDRGPFIDADLGMVHGKNITTGESATGGLLRMRAGSGQPTDPRVQGQSIEAAIGWQGGRTIGRLDLSAITPHYFAKDFHANFGIRLDATHNIFRPLSMEMGLGRNNDNGAMKGHSAIRLVLVSIVEDRNLADNGYGMQSGIRVRSEQRIGRYVFFDFGAEASVEYWRSGRQKLNHPFYGAIEVDTAEEGFGLYQSGQAGLSVRFPLLGHTGYVRLEGRTDKLQYKLKSIDPYSANPKDPEILGITEHSMEDLSGTISIGGTW